MPALREQEGRAWGGRPRRGHCNWTAQPRQLVPPITGARFARKAEVTQCIENDRLRMNVISLNDSQSFLWPSSFGNKNKRLIGPMNFCAIYQLSRARSAPPRAISFVMRPTSNVWGYLVFVIVQCIRLWTRNLRLRLTPVTAGYIN